MKIVRLKGIIIPNSWTKDGIVSSVAIAGDDESITPVKTGTGMSAKLIKCLNQTVAVEGVWEDTDRSNKTLNVITLEMLGD